LRFEPLGYQAWESASFRKERALPKGVKNLFFISAF
jgi:hypothetical protein